MEQEAFLEFWTRPRSFTGAELFTYLTLRLSSPATAWQMLSYLTSGKTLCFVVIIQSLHAGVAPGKPLRFASSAENPSSHSSPVQLSSFFFFFTHFSFHTMREKETFPSAWMETFLQARGQGEEGLADRDDGGDQLLLMLLARTGWKGIRWSLNPSE